MRLKSVEKLYHGSDKKFESFDLGYANAFKDYGKGFYLTSSYRQAQKWAQQKARNKTATYIYSYSIDCQLLFTGQWRILELLKYDKDWIDFIVESRIAGAESEYDVIYDRIADNTYDSISETLLKYSNHEVSHQKAIEIIQFKRNDADQYCFKTPMGLSLLRKEETVVQNYVDGKWIQER